MSGECYAMLLQQKDIKNAFRLINEAYLVVNFTLYSHRDLVLIMKSEIKLAKPISIKSFECRKKRF
ncbi:CLUMA_CG000515, isoform A [Clunio marinus]|uniref:CLUMA_CG000515, isoform A n=1 Tax=Clunio marinus TaxID=568069 RepID=A0A1J1HGK5_9DIPT|nr:CLUMA_CG000515, isoform A [Clunio marinus]